ncbi:MAG: HDIG domain-containing metalloprotein, partial [Paludibacteraceae bacterium]
AITAPFAFEIYKSADELKKEQDSVLEKEFQPCYVIDNNILKRNIAKFLDNSSSSSSPLSKMYIKYITTEMKELYSTGIISSSENDRIKKEGHSNILVKKDNVAKSVSPNKLLSTKTAYEELIENAPAYLNKDILRSYDVNKYLEENINYDKETTDNLKNDILKNISLTKGRIQSGERIIDHGEIVTEKNHDILNSLKQSVLENREKNDSSSILFGQIIVIICALSIFYMYLFLFRKQFMRETKNVIFMLLMVVLICTLTSLAVKYDLSPYIIPYAILPIIITIFFDTRTALFLHITTVLLCSFIVPSEFEFIFLQITIGMISICTLKDLFQRSQLVKSACIIVLVYCVLYVGEILIHERALEQINWYTFLSFLINGLLLLFAYPLIYIFEKTFGYVSDVTLVELANTNNKLLREFSEIAPGSFQHSMQVSNLAADATLSIGGNPMLARTGALYHDIGKMSNPVFFTENQSGVNPHNEINDEEKSAQIIIKHVTDGISIAEKHGLPQKLQDFIRTHHALSKSKYFYYTFKNKYPDKEVDESKFTYPGPLPFSKEMAVVSMCDSVEAASRSMKEYTDKSINDLVEKIISDQINDGVFKNSPITLRDIEKVKYTLKEKLKTIYHTRISYPELAEQGNK